MKQNIITISGDSHIGKTTYINKHYDVTSPKVYKASYLDNHETLETNVAKNDYDTIIIDEINTYNDPQISQLIKHLLDILIAKDRDINLVLCGTCSAITPSTPEHYENLRKAGIDTVSVCLHLSGYNHYKFATIHTNLARRADMTTHAFMVSDLRDPMEDVQAFTKRFSQLGYSNGSKITIWVTSGRYVADREDRIVKTIELLSRYHSRENIDVAFYKRDLDAQVYDLSKLPKMLNLTVVNCGALSSGIDSNNVADTYIQEVEQAMKDHQELAYQLANYIAVLHIPVKKTAKTKDSYCQLVAQMFADWCKYAWQNNFNYPNLEYPEKACSNYAIVDSFIMGMTDFHGYSFKEDTQQLQCKIAQGLNVKLVNKQN